MCYLKLAIYTVSVIHVDDIPNISLKENIISFMKFWNLKKIFDSVPIFKYFENNDENMFYLAIWDYT